MSNKKTRKNGHILLIACLGFWLVVGLFLLRTLNVSYLQRNIKRSVLGMDKEMQSLIEKGLNHDELQKSQTGLNVFMNDSLVFWNFNEANPKLMKRKVNLGNDTICTLLSGDYYVKSYRNGTMTYYVYRLFNTTYPFENQYFDNVIQTLPPFIDAKIAIVDNQDGIPVTNAQGKLLCRYQIIHKPTLKKPFKAPLLIAFLLSFGMAAATSFRKPRKAKTTEKQQRRRIQIGIATIIGISAAGTYIYHIVNEKRENESMRGQAYSLIEKRDPSFESSYSNFAEQMKADTNVREMLFAESNVLADVILGYSKELLFDDNMKAYSVSLTVCSPKEEITVQPEGYVADCDDYFLEKLANNDKTLIAENLYFIDYNTLDPNYLAKIKILSQDSLQQKTLYFEFYKPIAPEGFGFPQLLTETNAQKHNDYSVANYKNDILVYKFGRYIYPNFSKDLNVKADEISYSDKYKHFCVKKGEANTVVISTPRKGWSETTAPFAVFFLSLLTFFLLAYWLLKPKEEKESDKKKERSLRRRMQTVVFSTLALAVITVGPVSVFYMRGIYNQKTTETQFETTRTLSMELANDLDFKALMESAPRDTWTDILQHYANTFFTDLNLYQTNGQLLATTRPEINELNLQAPLMNAEAYQQMYHNKALFFSHEERLGKGKYESSYIPITDDGGNTLAFLNTPYFSSSAELHKEIQRFILTYINIILFLLGIALSIIIHITDRLTQPLALIQDKLRNTKFDQKNEPIEWKRNDEIGELVEQYNQLIIKLEKSVAELKRTTAESAWRGVARQVAHEIKNSLTPMRLSVQLLQRNIDNGKASPEQIQRTTNTLIEQIDALSDIAASFSRYAKLPENHPQPLDLAELVGNVVNLYDNVDNITFHYTYAPSDDYTFNGDKTNLNSAFGNLIKNAVQAIGSKPDGRIEVALKNDGNRFTISVKDNGKGIKEEDKGQIFLPNFTTKTGGSGVGLSLTYNIVQAAGGSISFESEAGEGAVFVIQLPKG